MFSFRLGVFGVLNPMELKLKLLQVVEQKVRLWKGERERGRKRSQMIFFHKQFPRKRQRACEAQLNVKQEENLFEFLPFRM